MLHVKKYTCLVIRNSEIFATNCYNWSKWMSEHAQQMNPYKISEKHIAYLTLWHKTSAIYDINILSFAVYSK